MCQPVHNTSNDERNNIHLDKFDKHIDRWSKIAQVLIGVFVIIFTIRFWSIANEIAELNYKSSVDQRHFQIRPNIELMKTLSYSPDYKRIFIQIRNYGSGTAHGLRLLIEHNDSINYRIEHLFYPAGIIAYPSGQIRTNANGLGKDWIVYNETLECVVGSRWQYADYEVDKLQATQVVYTIYLSYFDIDGTEYMKIFKNLGAGRMIAKYMTFDEEFVDSLKAMASEVELGSGVLFENTSLRDETGWFKYFKEPK